MSEKYKTMFEDSQNLLHVGSLWCMNGLHVGDIWCVDGVLLGVFKLHVGAWMTSFGARKLGLKVLKHYDPTHWQSSVRGWPPRW